MSTAFGYRPQMAGGKFAPTVRYSVVPRSRVYGAPLPTFDRWLPFPALVCSWECLEEHAGSGEHPDRTLSPGQIIREAAKRHGVSVATLRGNSHAPNLIAPRTEASRLMRSMGMSYPAIGRALKKHHTTIMLYLRPARAPRPTTPEYRARKALRDKGRKRG